MLPSLPDECKQLLWQCLDAQTLCRIACVSRCVDQGVALAPLWKRHAIEMARREIARIEIQRLPTDGNALQRQNATRRFDLSAHNNSSLPGSGRHRSLLGQYEEKNDSEDGKVRISPAVDVRCWRVSYRDFHLAMRGFVAAHTAFDAAKTELQTLKRQRSDLRELLQATKSTSQSDKHLRRLQMNCVRWLNRTSRRAAATSQARTAQTTALTKSEISDELQSMESAIQWQAKLIFSVRSQYQKALHQRTKQIADAKRILAEQEQ